uniref:PiggyBac transposable element-derived protein domain-containing protein n=1 Tax=Scylla olivacea TaxID=85551 RepID=A0A0P4WNR9_SCYOL
MKWVDNRCVTLLTSFSSAQPLGTCKRYDKKRKEIVEIPCPKIVKTYNEEMGGVDLLDSLIALYRIHIRSHKYYHKLVFHFLDVTIVNSWLLYRRDASAIGVSKKSQLQLQAFKLKVAYSLLRQNKDPLKRPGVGRPRSSSLETEHEEKKREVMQQNQFQVLTSQKMELATGPRLLRRRKDLVASYQIVKEGQTHTAANAMLHFA